MILKDDVIFKEKLTGGLKNEQTQVRKCAH